MASDTAARTRLSRLPVFASAQSEREDPEAATLAEETSVVEQHFERNALRGFDDVHTRLIQVAIGRESDSTRLAVDILEAWTTDGDSGGSLSWQSRSSLLKKSDVSARLLVVSSIQQGVMNYVDYSDDDGASGRVGKQTLPRFASKLSPSTPVNMSLEGEGFHRRVVLDVDATSVLSSDACEPATSRVLVRIPLAHEVYMDLDELRVRIQVAAY